MAWKNIADWVKQTRGLDHHSQPQTIITNMASIHAVFNTGELLDNILAQLSTTDLVRVSSVNRF